MTIATKFSVVVYLLLFSCFACFGDEKGVDAAMSQKLKKFRQEDNLLKWIDVRNNYFLEQPSKRLEVLEETESEAWRAPQTSEEKEAWLYLMVYQGYYQLYNGDILKSIEKYEEAYQYHLKNKVSIDVDEYILKPLANNYTRIGDYPRAIYLQTQSLKIAARNQNKPLMASVSGNLALSYLFSGSFDNAEQSAANGLEVVATNSPVKGLLKSILAEVHHIRKDDLEALRLAKEAIHILHNTNGKPYWLMGAYSLAGDICLDLKDYALADVYYKSAFGIHARNFRAGRRRELARLYTSKSKSALAQNQVRSAIELASKAVSTLIPDLAAHEQPVKAQLYAENRLQEALLQLGKIKEHTKDMQGALSYYLLAFQVNENLRNEFSYQASKQQLQEESKIQTEKLMELAFRLYQDKKDEKFAQLMLEISEKSKARMLSDQIQENLLKNSSGNPLFKKKLKLEQLLSYYQKQQREEKRLDLKPKINALQFELSTLQKKLRSNLPLLTPKADNVLKKIPEGSKAIIYFFGQSAVYVITAERNHILTITRRAGATSIHQNIENFLNTYFYNGPTAMINHPKAFYKASNLIFKAVLPDLDLHAKEPLIIIRDGILNLLSFESLIVDATYRQQLNSWPYLMKRHAVFYQYSLGLIEKETIKINPAKFSGLFISKNKRNPTEIIAVEKEYKELKNCIEGGFYRSEESTNDRFIASLQQNNVIHISSHAYLEEKNKDPVLELYDKNFYLFDLGGISHIPELVVLSACQTGEGEMVSGEGVLSMSRGFFAAGSKGIISGLWKVNDAVGAELSANFYRQLLKSSDPAQALRQAKLQWIENPATSPILKLPYYWDSLNYTGNNLNIHLPTPGFSLHGWVISGLVLLATAAFVAYKKRKSRKS